MLTIHATSTPELTRLNDGILVNKKEDVRTLALQYEVIITIQPPTWPPDVLTAIQQLRGRVVDVMTIHTLNIEDRTNWLSRLDMMLHKVSKNLTMNIVYNRHKRSLFGVIGKLSKSLFGTATEGDVQRIATVLQQNSNAQNKVIHQVNELLTIVNHSNAEIQVNRDRLNLLTNITRKTIQHIQDIVSETNKLANKLKSMRVNMMFEEAISQFEHCVSTIEEQHNLYHRQKIQLEAERFTHELLGRAELNNILRQHHGGNIAVIQPLNWYYMYCVAEPIWTGKDLVYRVILPLVNRDAIVKYRLQTFPVRHNTSRTTTRLNVEEQVAIDKATGWVLKVFDCVGQNPEVCRSNIAVPSRDNCELSIIIGRKRGYSSCKVTLTNQAEYDDVTEIAESHYAIQSSGGIVEIRCQGKIPRRVDMSPGVYLLHVRPECMYATDRWMLKPIPYVKGRIDIKFASVKIPNINVRDVVQGYIKNFELSLDKIKDLSAVKVISLKPLKEGNFVKVSDLLNTDLSITDVVGFVLIAILYIYVIMVLCKGLNLKRFCTSTHDDKGPIDVKVEGECNANVNVKKEVIDLAKSNLYPQLPTTSAASAPTFQDLLSRMNENESAAQPMNVRVKVERE